MPTVHRAPPPVRLRPRRRHGRRRPSVFELMGLVRRRAGRPPGRGGGPGRRAVLAALLAAGAVAAAAPAGPAAAGTRAPAEPGPVVHTPPVDAPIVDPFRPPPGPYGPGNRGLEYGTERGDVVRASADGTVSFAGPVAGSLHVTVLHADGVRTSYSFLATVEVAVGQRVRQGDRLGTAGGRLHFGARLGDAYVDPAALFGTTTTDVELLPFEVPPGSDPAAEARALVLLALAEGGGLPGLPDVVDWLRDRAGAGVGYVAELNPWVRGLEMGLDLADRLLSPGPCSDGPPPVAPVAGEPRRVAVTVGGLGSTSTSAAIDDLRVDELGYDPDRVVRFSYAGGRTPGTGRAFPELATTSYRSAHTQGDVTVAADRLADLIEQVLAADPEAVVDVHAHSLGGLVARLAVMELADRGVDPARLGTLVTLGTPHRGADLATALRAVDTTVALDAAVDLAARRVGLDLDAIVFDQLAEGSEVVRRLRHAGPPPGVDLVSIAARGDLTVAAPQTEVSGAANVTVPLAGPSAHGDLVGSDEATAEVARALAGQPPGCEPWHDAVADVVGGHAVSYVTDQLGALSLAAP
ncbi:MAG: peptidoglycan DD-metalloendopeptidase family protein [Acidimicrobiia bacterium]